jgi:hypothetical protein
MSAPKIDVLAVMLADAEAAMTLRGFVTGEGTESTARKVSDEARAAVAELIEAVGNHLESLESYGTNPVPINREGGTVRALTAALARIGGDA